MEKNVIGVIGGSGAIGLPLVKSLLENIESYSILVGSRTETKEIKILKENSYRCNFQNVNCFEEDSLQKFCENCSIIVNATGPSYKIEDCIAKVAIANKCHYIDVGGYDNLYEKLIDKEPELKTTNKTVILGAGWMPGISGVFSLHCIDTALNKNDTVDNVQIFYGAVENWSENSIYDIATSAKNDSFFILNKGVKRRPSIRKVILKKSIPFLNKTKLCAIQFNYELEAYAKEKLKNVESISSYAILGDLKSFFTYLTLPKKNDKSTIKIKRDNIRLHSQQGSWGIVYVELKSKIKQKKMTCSLYTKDNLKLTYLPLMLTIKGLLENKCKMGLGHLGDMVDRVWFIEELRKKGIKINIIEC